MNVLSLIYGSNGSCQFATASLESSTKLVCGLGVLSAMMDDECGDELVKEKCGQP
jgi:hypothetical protein